MSAFFSGTRPGRPVKHGAAEFELPILYFRDDLFMLFFTADFDRVRSRMPSKKLHPVRMPGHRAMVGIAAFNYLDTSIGPYGEVGVVAPAVWGDSSPLPVVPALREANHPGFGTVVLHLPVTKTVARDAGRGEWGYTKFVADMAFTNTPEVHQVGLSEGGTSILSMRVAKKGFVKKDKRPLITYSVKNGDLVKTVIPARGTMRMSLNPTGSALELGDHPVAESIREMGLSAKPLQSRYFVERSAILPSGEIIERGVEPLEGYRGQDVEGEHTVVYT